MSDEKKYAESKRFVVRGLLALAVGSLLLLAPKMIAVPEFLSTPVLVAGSVSLLYGNGCIIFGLLIHAGKSVPR